jgi:hypothetical protein
MPLVLFGKKEQIRNNIQFMLFEIIGRRQVTNPLPGQIVNNPPADCMNSQS